MISAIVLDDGLYLLHELWHRSYPAAPCYKHHHERREGIEESEERGGMNVDLVFLGGITRGLGRYSESRRWCWRPEERKERQCLSHKGS